jgi:tRNA(fMet)-specific endonuclease VapC
MYSCIKLYAKEKVRLRKTGKSINDEFGLLIGVSSVNNKLTLVTDNITDFQNIEDVKIEN